MKYFSFLKVTEASSPVLKDAFYCLASDQIKLASLKSKASEDEPETEQDRAGMVLEAARKQIISGVVKKNVIENIIPIIIALKHKLESVNSPLLGELFNYLRKLMEDYKNEVSEILAADKQLAKEIEFDLRRHEQEERERKEREQVNVAHKLHKSGHFLAVFSATNRINRVIVINSFSYLKWSLDSREN